MITNTQVVGFFVLMIFAFGFFALMIHDVYKQGKAAVRDSRGRFIKGRGWSDGAR